MFAHSLLRTETHQNERFPLSIYACHLSDTFFLRAHFHDHFEILYITQGNVTIQIGETTYEATKGDILFANMFQIHSATTYVGHTATLEAIVFHKDILAILNIHDYHLKYIEPFLSGQERFPAMLNMNTKLYQATKASLDVILSEDTLRPTAYEVFIKTEIERMMANFFRYKSTLETSSNQQISKGHQELLNQISAYIGEHYHLTITLDEISTSLGMDKSYFCRLIKRLTGRSFTQFLNIYRVKQAELLLKKTSYPVSLVSEKVGFVNHSYFNKVFREYTGMTPSKFRKLVI